MKKIFEEASCAYANENTSETWCDGTFHLNFGQLPSTVTTCDCDSKVNLAAWIAKHTSHLELDIPILQVDELEEAHIHHFRSDFEPETKFSVSNTVKRYCVNGQHITWVSNEGNQNFWRPQRLCDGICHLNDTCNINAPWLCSTLLDALRMSPAHIFKFDCNNPKQFDFAVETLTTIVEKTFHPCLEVISGKLTMIKGSQLDIARCGPMVYLNLIQSLKNLQGEKRSVALAIAERLLKGIPVN